MTVIEQEDDDGCGAACVAMLAGVSYADARKTIYPSGRSRLTKTQDLHDALVRLGRKPVSSRRIAFGQKKLDDLESDALVFVEIANKDAPKHWMVWDSQARVLHDPLPGQRKFKLRGYLPVE